MDTSLKADTINSMQPTQISQYMLNNSQVPDNKNCTSQNTNQTNCSVRHYRHQVLYRKVVAAVVCRFFVLIKKKNGDFLFLK